MILTDGSPNRPMKLSRHSEYALLTLTYLAARPGRLAPIGQIARSLGVSHNHLMKIVPDLRKAGFVQVVRGRSGGVRLAREAVDLRLAEVIRHTERALFVPPIASYDLASPISAAWQSATAEFMSSLERRTLADLVNSETGGSSK
ncbi:MAG TPA: Rrf2 family transcriptional regulator [Sphingomicrobium sp.]|nr:Rrf2 family transcriptional regulator [Sphingomicrobium sp.]